MADAFKLIPSHKNDWKFFGFKWLAKFFADTTNPFGSKAAPANFDDLGETLVNIAKTLSNTPSVLINRQLDDVLVVSPESTKFAENFFHTYKKVCNSLNIELAPDCPNFEKAFPPSHFGKVLGINFNAKNLSWELPVKKQKETLSKIQHMIEAKNCNLLQFQKLHGKLNDFANLCPLTKGFRAHQNEFLKILQLDENKIVDIPKEVKTELKFWSNCINAAKNGFPIPDLTEDAPFFAIFEFSRTPREPRFQTPNSSKTTRVQPRLS
jgi:hypothetical protein